MRYITGRNNIKADALSHNTAACHSQPSSKFENHIYAMFVDNDHFLDQLKEEQKKDPYICSTKDAIESNMKVTVGRLKTVRHQLQIIDSLLTKSGRPVLPPALRKFVVGEYQNISHFGTDKVYTLLKERFYCICQICQILYCWLSNVSEVRVCSKSAKSPNTAHACTISSNATHFIGYCLLSKGY